MSSSIDGSSSHPVPSTSNAPDLDWSQITETVRMLNLAVAQIAMAMHQGEDSVSSLTASFTGMVGSVAEISTKATQLDDDLAIKQDIIGNCIDVQSGIEQTIVAFQFYDRLSQRLEHVRHSLEQLSDLVADRSRLYNPQQWQGLQHIIRSKYTMDEEQQMFDILLGGATIEEALSVVKSRLDQGELNEIELF